MKSIVFTICAQNYLPHAAALYHSFQEVYTDSADQPDFVLVLTDIFQDVTLPNRIPAMSAQDMNIPHYNSLAFKFSISELCTTVKPYAFTHLFAQGYEHVIYMDPDMYLYSPLERTLQQLQEYALVLTPSIHHIDNSFRSEYEHYSVGVFNLGFAAMRKHPRMDALLHWWQDRCALYGFKQYKHYGVFYDQKFMDRAPIYARELLYVECHDGYNVGRWNLQERGLRCEKGQFFTNEDPLVFYHFSGLGRLPLSHPATAEIVASVTRAGGADVMRLHEEYISRVLAYPDYDAARACPYGYACYDNGVPIPDNHRTIYATQHEQLINSGRTGQFSQSAMDDPFGTGPGSFYQELLDRNCFVLGI